MRRSPVVDLRCHGGRLLALHDATFSLDDAPLLPQRNVLRAVDVASQVLQPLLWLHVSSVTVPPSSDNDTSTVRRAAADAAPGRCAQICEDYFQ
jgi:hypothetical protein